MEVLPLVPGEYAMPMRGIIAFFCGCGSPKVIKPGTSEIAFLVCCRSPWGTVWYSYRRPIFTVKFGSSFQLSLAKKPVKTRSPCPATTAALHTQIGAAAAGLARSLRQGRAAVPRCDSDNLFGLGKVTGDGMTLAAVDERRFFSGADVLCFPASIRPAI